MKKPFYVYIMCNKMNGTLYIGVTANLLKRVFEHKNKLVDGFAKQYGLDQLVYYEEFMSQEEAFLREKRLKTWKREWKIQLIKNANPDWRDLYQELI